MKATIIFLFYFFSSYTAFTQNWIPFRVGETYNYVDNNSNFVYSSINFGGDPCYGPYAGAPPYYSPAIPVQATSSSEIQVWIDSVTATNGDSTFHFNRRIYRCDTCAQPAIITNQPLNLGILHERFVKTTANQYIFDYNGDSLLLDTHLSFGDSIISDISNMLTVAVTAVNYNLLPNYTNHTNGVDSSKVFSYYQYGILLYQLVLTKNLGIYSFTDFWTMAAPDVTQVGIESKHMGVVQLQTKEIFDYQVGDEFTYQSVNKWNQDVDHYIRTIRVLSHVRTTPDSTIFRAERIGWWMNSCCPYTSGSSIDTFDLIVSSNYVRNGVFEYREADCAKLALRDNELSDYFFTIFGNQFTFLAKNFLKDASRRYKYIGYSYGLETLHPQNSSSTSSPCL